MKTLLRTALFMTLAAAHLRAAPPVEFLSPNITDQGAFGATVASVPDVNGDGHEDFLIPATRDTAPGGIPNAGRAYLYSGIDQTLLRTFAPPVEVSESLFGDWACGLTDINGDGFGDVAIGYKRATLPGNPIQSGAVYVYSGATGALLLSLSSPHPQTNALLGDGLRGVPDTNGDGKMDIIVNALSETPPGGLTEEGKAYLFSGADGSVLQEFFSPSPAAFGLFSSQVYGIKDIDGDGRGDVVVGAIGEDGNAGRVHVFSGRTGTLLFSISSPHPDPGGQFGWQVSSVPDVDGDGKDEITTGGSRENPSGSPTDSGRAYIFSGADGSLMRDIASFRECDQGWFGFEVSGLTDQDGDGAGDLLIGALFESYPGEPQYCGHGYIVSGRTGRFIASFASPHPQYGGQFGIAVCGVKNAQGKTVYALLGAGSETPPGGSYQPGRAYLFDSHQDNAVAGWELYQ